MGEQRKMSFISRHIKKIFIFIAVSAIAVTAIKAFDYYEDYKKEKTRWAGLKDAIIAHTEGFKGTAYIVVKDYNRNLRIDIASDMQVPAASIIKVPIMGAVFSAQEEGKLSLSDKIKLRQKDKVSGSGTLKNARSGKEYSIEELLMLMNTISDNTATNMIINLVGFDYLNNWFKDNGLKGTILLRLMMDMASRDKGIENYTTAGDMAVVFDNMYRGKLINEDVSSECIEILKNQKTRNRIPAKLPKGTMVAHKTGLERGICHDAGIVFTPNGNFLICVLTRHEYSNSFRSRELISKIALTVYRYYVPEQ
jgi:beta-lactamase class A